MLSSIQRQGSPPVSGSLAVDVDRQRYYVVQGVGMTVLVTANVEFPAVE